MGGRLKEKAHSKVAHQVACLAGPDANQTTPEEVELLRVSYVYIGGAFCRCTKQNLGDFGDGGQGSCVWKYG